MVLLVLFWMLISSLTINLGVAALKSFCVKWFILWFQLKIECYQRQVYKFVKTYKVSNALVLQLRSAVEACNPLSREKRPSSIFTFRSSSFPISCSIGLPWDFVNIQLELQVLFCLHKTLNLAIVMFCTHLCTTTKFYLNYWRYTVSISFLSCFWKFLKFFWFDSQGSYSTFKLDFQVLMHNNARHLHSLKYLSQPSH